MEEEGKDQRKKDLMAVHDTMDVLNGKWKISIITSIYYYNKRRFTNILNDIPGISNKMLSKELKELEQGLLIQRTVLDTQAITVEYQLTAYGLTLQNIIKSLCDWEKEHRKVITAK